MDSRRAFLRWASASPLALAACQLTSPAARDARNVFDLEQRARRRMEPGAFAYLAGGADDERTLLANRDAFGHFEIRARRLVDVSRVDTSLELFGERHLSPVLLAPVGFQEVFHPRGELETARGLRGHGMIASSVSSFAVGKIAREAGRAPWFQLYPTPNRVVTQGLLERAEAAGCRVVVLTVDTPAIGNRERHKELLKSLLTGARKENYDGLILDEAVVDPAMTWDMIPWLKANCGMHVVLKGIVTHEDAALALDHGADGLIVSNHGGRQLDAGRATLACLPEVVETVAGRLPVLIDGGFRRGTDVFKALALGASAVCIGRPYCWGLGAFGAEGVARALELLQAELVLDMQLAGTPSLGAIGAASVAHRSL